MFKSARWRSEKNKVKAEFKLQFYVTQVSQSVVDALTLSVVPGDVGKPTARLDKVTVTDGSCKWETPVYETVKFVRDTKSGKINEKTYYFLVSMGRAKSRVLGEVSINLADYADATKSSSVSLPLKNSNSDVVLHVLIQKLQAKIEPREGEDFDNVSIGSQETSLKSYLSNGEVDESIKSNCTEDEQISKSPHDFELNGDCRESSGSDITLSSSESSSGFDTPREHQPVSLSALPRTPVTSLSTTTNKENQRSQSIWPLGSDHGVSIDESSDDMPPVDRSGPVMRSEERVVNIEIEKLKAELVGFSRQAEVSELELQTLRKQIVKESKRGQDLSKEIVILKEERDSLREECEKLKSKSKNKMELEDKKIEALLEETKEELNQEKELNANIRLQLQKTQKANDELILAMRDLEEMLEQKNGPSVRLYDRSRFSENAEGFYNTISKCESENDEEQKALENLVKQHSDANETYLLEQKVVDLYSEVEFYKREKDELEMIMEQLALDYEILKQENHGMSYKLEQCELQEKLDMKEECTPSATIVELETHIEHLDRELKQRSKDFSDSLSTIKELEAHMQALEEELEQQAEKFVADLEDMTCAKIEQEQRAILAEEDLRKTRSRNASTAKRLQEELKRVSLQIVSTFDANEKVAAKAVAESIELQLQKIQLDEKLVSTNKELQSVKEESDAKLRELSNLVDLQTRQIEQMFLELHTKSKLLDRQEIQKEVCESLSREILLLKYEIERLTRENKSLKEGESLNQIKNMERNELVTAIALIMKEGEKFQNELNRRRHQNVEHEISMGCLQTELEVLRDHCSDLKHSLVEGEIEKDKLRHQVFLLNDDLKKVKEFNGVDMLWHSDEQAAACDGVEAFTESTKSTASESSPKEVAALKGKIELLERKISLKEDAIETLASKISEKAMDFQLTIEELESKLEEVVPTSKIQEEDNQGQSKNTSSSIEYGNGVSVGRNDIISPETDKLDDSDNNGDKFSTELALLRERNKSMESELKEMQERYSEISLKFAEQEVAVGRIEALDIVMSDRCSVEDFMSELYRIEGEKYRKRCCR
ncbi:myosin-3-like isoform X5 [Cucurbita pepo subsp. pepo]|uniref:myosin-3-like isoform X5 n=1 Tax=Cucurbita pepo subsp. pepo TaxID=3664 RepID=UPI000C9D58FB|nr:myosin-3-like isoform X5 [Cucurbita pepo subsp. pepo]